MEQRLLWLLLPALACLACLDESADPFCMRFHFHPLNPQALSLFAGLMVRHGGSRWNGPPIPPDELCLAHTVDPILLMRFASFAKARPSKITCGVMTMLVKKIIEYLVNHPSSFQPPPAVEFKAWAERLHHTMWKIVPKGMSHQWDSMGLKIVPL